MKIIITGNKGFLGSRLAKKLEKIHTVIGLNRASADLSDYKAVHNFISEHKPEVVIHCAAIGDIGVCEDNKELAYKSNYVASVNIASACADNNCRMIYISSDQVYDGFTKEPITELAETNPNNYYGKLKREAEKAIQIIVSKSHIARIGWQYDWYNKAIKDDSRGGLLAQIGEAVSQNRPIYCSSNSHQFICYVQDTIEALTKMAEQAVPYGIYNIAQETDKSMEEIFLFAMKSLGIDEETIKSLVIAQEADKPYNLCAKAFNLEMCGHKMPSFEEGLLRCIRENS
jgi:dTDP-4-dehydrorhamnose reductase